MSYGNRIYFTDDPNLEHNPPGSPEALYAIYITAISKEGANRPDYVPWTHEHRAAMYRHEYYNERPQPMPTLTHRCLGCGTPISVKERCKACQHEFRQNNYRVPDKIVHCMDCGIEVPYTLSKPKRCAEHAAEYERKCDTESKARRRAEQQRQGVPA